MVATEVLELDHVPPPEEAVHVVELPAHRVVVPEIVNGAYGV